MHTIPAGTRTIPSQHSIPPARPALHATLAAHARTIPPPMKAGNKPSPTASILARSEGVMTRVRMINTMLRIHGIDCTDLDILTKSGLVQLAAVQGMISAGNRPGTLSAFSRFRTTITRLRDTYRDILTYEDLPGDTAQGILSVAQALDVTAVQIPIP